jgi:hypothetical protein
MTITQNYYRRLFDIIIRELNMERFTDLYDAEIHGFNREQKMVVLIQLIIMHSMYNQDIQNRYKIILDVNIHPTAEMQYIRSAKIEYTKLMKYIYHITNKTPRTYLFVVEYPIENSLNSSDIPYKTELNKHIVSEIKLVRSIIAEIQQKIETIKQIMSDFIDPIDNYQQDHLTAFFLTQKLIHIKCSPNISRLGPSSFISPNDRDTIDNMNILDNNINVVQDEIRFLENKIKCLKKMKEDYTTFDMLTIDLVKNETFLRKYHLKYDLYLKMVRLDTKNINKLPEDTIKIIHEYIGEDYLNEIRHHCMYKKYFPHGREDIKNTLKLWKKEELINYGNQTFLRYNINTENRYYRFRKIWIVRSWTKDKIIDQITRNTMIYTFPDFQRDIYIITKLLKEKRNKKQRNKKQRNKKEIHQK